MGKGHWLTCGQSCVPGQETEARTLLVATSGLGLDKRLYFGARDYFQGTGSEPNPFLGAAGELGPSSVVTKVSGGELWCGPNVLHKPVTQQSGMRLYQRSG